jgi:hypothetical protein
MEWNGMELMAQLSLSECGLSYPTDLRDPSSRLVRVEHDAALDFFQPLFELCISTIDLPRIETPPLHFHRSPDNEFHRLHVSYDMPECVARDNDRVVILHGVEKLIST